MHSLAVADLVGKDFTESVLRSHGLKHRSDLSEARSFRHSLDSRQRVFRR